MRADPPHLERAGVPEALAGAGLEDLGPGGGAPIVAVHCGRPTVGTGVAATAIHELAPAGAGPLPGPTHRDRSVGVDRFHRPISAQSPGRSLATRRVPSRIAVASVSRPAPEQAVPVRAWMGNQPK